MENINTGEVLPFDLSDAIVQATFLDHWKLTGEGESVQLKGKLNGWVHEGGQVLAIRITHGVRFIQASTGRLYRLGRKESSTWVAQLWQKCPAAYRVLFEHGFI